MSKYYCYPYKKYGAKDTMVSIASKNLEGSDEIKYVQNNIVKFDKERTALAAFEDKNESDPSKSFYHLFTFNN